MKKIILLTGAFYGFLSVILGAFGSHLLKRVLSSEKIQVFDIGVKNQMYHALVLLFIGMFFPFSNALQKSMGYAFIIGVFLFSFSIYGLVFADKFNYSKTFLGPVTPIGGFLMIVGWVLLIINLIWYKI